ncbi:hypothetical protein B0A48_14169 [Cryoendolithus antarcticus]|uniref:Uncharacterized protein n=1 Tax=Cryoendolithus antarcticus TaxID=1507870 RepID=A0A1V8SLC6_9PEZI|nr:hypothetical protein B0A48_14169 [Cryoendolithus antarcticus]
MKTFVAKFIEVRKYRKNILRMLSTTPDAILDHETVYFTKEMKSGYEAGANIRGTGQKALLVHELDGHFKDKRPYEKALAELKRHVVEDSKSFKAVEDLTTKKSATFTKVQPRMPIRLVLSTERAKLAGAAQKLADIRAKYPEVQGEDLTTVQTNGL